MSLRIALCFLVTSSIILLNICITSSSLKVLVGSLNVKEYAREYAENKLDDYIKKNVTIQKTQLDKLKAIYLKSTKEFNISWIKCNNKKIRNKEEGNISVILNNMTINNNPISNNIKLTDNIYISKD